VDKTFPFEFRFSNAQSEREGERLEAFMRKQIEALLDIVVLTKGGEPVHVDGFVWVKDAFKGETSAPEVPMRIGMPGPRY
jgi:hypothetical protein